MKRVRGMCVCFFHILFKLIYFKKIPHHIKDILLKTDRIEMGIISKSMHKHLQNGVSIHLSSINAKMQSPQSITYFTHKWREH